MAGPGDAAARFAFPETRLTRQPVLKRRCLANLRGAQTPTRNDVYRRMGRH